jgi:pyridoxal phosphate enzyme (YggS family)
LTVDAARVAERLAVVRERIRSAGGDEGVAVVAVTKSFAADAVDAAVAAGCRSIGESYAQELVAKLAGVATSPEVRFIGRLQTNKVRALVDAVDVFETVDRVPLAEEVARRAPHARVLVQVNTTGETSKGGCAVGDVAALVERCAALGLRVEGLMSVGPTGAPPAAARAGFREVRALVDRLDLATCSMGMSGDLEVAVGEGSTEVRVGSALFGGRPTASR